MQYLKKSRVNDRMRAGRSFIMETSFEEITRKYRLMKTGKINVDLLSLKSARAIVEVVCWKFLQVMV